MERAALYLVSLLGTYGQAFGRLLIFLLLYSFLQ